MIEWLSITGSQAHRFGFWNLLVDIKKMRNNSCFREKKEGEKVG
jgi:hypothetical protein